MHLLDVCSMTARCLLDRANGVLGLGCKLMSGYGMRKQRLAPLGSSGNTFLFRTVVINAKFKKDTQLSVKWPNVLVVSDLQGHPSSMIFMSFESQYAISY